MKIQTHLSGGIKTWGMILLFACLLSTLGLIYDWIYQASQTVSTTFCKEISYLTNIVP